MSSQNLWNSIEYDYRNAAFNRYTLSPGDAKVQSGAMAVGSVSNTPVQQAEEQKIQENGQANVGLYSICVKRIPQQFTDDRNVALMNLCSNYGKVLRVRSVAVGNIKFADFNSSVEMEKVLSALKNNQYGMVFEAAKNNSLRNSNSGASSSFSKAPTTNNKSKIDMSRRSKTPFKIPSQPDFSKNQKDLVNGCNEQTNLQTAERYPKRRLQQLQHVKNSTANTAGNVAAVAGDNHMVSQEVIENLRKGAAAAEGCHDKLKGAFVRLAKDPTLNSIEAGSCLLCNKRCVHVCQRCGDFYCSVECQKKDFPQHRYICFALPQLVTSNSDTIGKIAVPSEEPSLQRVEVQSNRNTLNQQALPTPSNGCVKQNGIDINKPTTSGIAAPALSKSNAEIKVLNLNPPNNNKLNSFKVFPKPQKKSVTTVQEKEVEPRNPDDKHLIPVGTFPKSGSIIAITAVAKTNLVFIRSLESKAKVEYLKILNIIKSHGANAKNVSKMPTPGDICITDFEGTGFNRVLVLNVKSESEIIVLYVDFGNIDKKKLSDLKDLPEPCWALARQAVACFLKGVPEFEPNEDVQKYMYSFVRELGKDLKIVYTDPECTELIDTATNENFNQKIIQLKEVAVPEIDPSPVFIKEIEMKMLPQQRNVPVVVLDNSLIGIGYICCIHKDDAIENENKSLNRKLAEYAEKTKEPYTPSENEICVALYDKNKQWYRAECIEAVGDGCPTLIFIDFGNILAVSIENIRPYPRKLIQPCYTNQCSISGLPEEISDDLAKRLQELLPVNFETCLDSVKAEQNEDFSTIEIKSVIEKLQAEGLI